MYITMETELCTGFTTRVIWLNKKACAYVSVVIIRDYGYNK